MKNIGCCRISTVAYVDKKGTGVAPKSGTPLFSFSHLHHFCKPTMAGTFPFLPFQMGHSRSFAPPFRFIVLFGGMMVFVWQKCGLFWFGGHFCVLAWCVSLPFFFPFFCIAITDSHGIGYSSFGSNRTAWVDWNLWQRFVKEK